MLVISDHPEVEPASTHSNIARKAVSSYFHPKGESPRVSCGPSEPYMARLGVARRGPAHLGVVLKMTPLATLRFVSRLPLPAEFLFNNCAR